MKKELKSIELTIADDEELGCSAIALVNQPAIEVDFLKFHNPINISFAKVDADKQIVTGPAMIPDKLIYRYNPKTNEEFNVWFSKETVEAISQKFLKEMRQSNVNLEHQDTLSDITVIESWIVKDPEVDKAKSLGYSVPENTWMISMKIENSDVWNQLVKTEKVKGFSIEGYFIDKFAAQTAVEEPEETEDITDDDLFELLVDILKIDSTFINEVIADLTPEEITEIYTDIIAVEPALAEPLTKELGNKLIVA